MFEDDDILLINKPSGLLSLSGKNPLNQDSVHFRLTQQYPDIRLLHRLDLGTSGVMLLAKNKAVNTALMQQFQARTIEKDYIALLDGLIKEQTFIIDLPIAKGEFPAQKICQQTGKAAQSKVSVLDANEVNQTTRVKLTPLTGRTHQLRIHCREIGHPILGCDIYNNNHSQKKAERLLLHAQSLSFDHPTTGARINAVCDCPF
ncbi:RluA family pseudouridine synthase [Reinekea sp.]|uniref:RluA family pseudouridine synthase n=1 Tax=Reinekea sp. TaxID=1970455 RepID=UPI0039896D39